MSAPHKAIALNLGMQTVAMAEFELLSNGGMVLSGYRRTELMVDPAADITRGEQLKFAIKELCQAFGWRAARGGTNLCLPSQAVFSRFVRLPGSSADEIRSIIGFEAQQNVPYPIDEVTWDHQILGGERDGSWDVALVAIKSDQLEEIFDACKEGGAAGKLVDVAPMALYNTYRFNYPSLTGTSLLIDIGARTTNLIFADGDKVFSRAIPIGGNSISVNIAKELEQDVTLAEALKVEKGFVALGGAYADAEDPTVAKISKVTRNTMTRLHAEIMRSISFYRANQGGRQPQRTFLCGGAVSMPYMLEFFTEKLQMPVEFLNPLRNVIIKDESVAASISGKLHSLGELVGVAARSLGDCPIDIDLRPRSAVNEERTRRRLPALIAALIGILLAGGAAFAYMQKAAALYGEAASEVRSDVAQLTALSGEIDKARAEQAALAALVDPLLLAVRERAYWLATIDALGASIPTRNIWITSLTPTSGGGPVTIEGAAPLSVAANVVTPTRRLVSPPRRPAATQESAPSDAPKAIDAIRIDGLYLENPKMAGVIDDFVNKLAKSDLFVINAEVKTKMVRSQPDGSSWAYKFSIEVPLKTPILLQ